MYSMKLFKQTVLVLTAILALNSCSSDDGESKRTNATISLKQAGEPAQGVTVYVYDEDTWSMIGDDPFFALGESVSDSNGKAKFSNLEYGLTFNDINNNQNTLT